MPVDYVYGVIAQIKIINPEMELQKYKNDGWGISQLGFTYLLQLIETSESVPTRILEFGSGSSTRFFCDIVKDGIKDMTITSFDNDITYAYKPTNTESFLTLNIRPLVECNDPEYLTQMLTQQYMPEHMRDKTSVLEPIQRNNFYRIEDGDLSGIYDIVLLDGPNGNGRNFAFLHIKPYVTSGSIIYIDDYNHYDFLEQCVANFDCEILVQHTEGIGHDNFVILKIK